MEDDWGTFYRYFRMNKTSFYKIKYVKKFAVYGKNLKS